jgi:hypothetical protein
VLEKRVSVKAAAEFSGYSIQYLRRLLRAGQLDGIKIGQVWLIKLASLKAYSKRAHCFGDGRLGRLRKRPACGTTSRLLKAAAPFDGEIKAA